MSKIERRHVTVPLYVGNYQSELTALLDEAMAAQRDEDAGQKRASTRSKALVLAKKYDDLLVEANESAIHVDVYEISNIEWQKLADDHPPRDGDSDDKQRGVNIKTFPGALLKAALGTPPPVDLDELSRVHYIKLEAAAWNLHNGDDALPKFSLVSFLKEAREADSKPPSDSE